jgi:hypothetical protein
MLQDRRLVLHKVEGRLRLTLERGISDVADDANDIPLCLRQNGREPEGDLPSRGIHADHVTAGEAFVHERDRRTRRPVIVGESATLEHADAHRIEEARADGAASRDDWRSRDALDVNERRGIVVGTSGEA